MATYAPVPAFAERKPHPRTLTFIVAAHAAVLAAVMAAKMDLVPAFTPTPTEVDFIEVPPPPPPEPAPPQPPQAQQPTESVIDTPPPLVKIPTPSPPIDVAFLPQPSFDPTIGTSVTRPLDRPATPLPVRTGPRFATPDSRLRPPYPASKIATEQEAALRLKLTIDARGRVVAVDPVAPADPVFLAAARQHLLAHWRYKPATEDGRPVASSTVITLRFQLDE